MTPDPLDYTACQYHGLVDRHEATFAVDLIWDNGNEPNAAFGVSGHFRSLGEALEWREAKLREQVAEGWPGEPACEEQRAQAGWCAIVERGTWEADGFIGLEWERDERWLDAEKGGWANPPLYEHEVSSGSPTSGPRASGEATHRQIQEPTDG